MDIHKKVADLAARAQLKSSQSESAVAAEKKQKGGQLPLWPEHVRAVPNGFLRSALFGSIGKGKRSYIESARIAALDGLQIIYTGMRLDQGDLDAYESVLHAVRLQELGSQCRVTSYYLLKLMGKTDSGKNRATLHKRLTRLRATAVEIWQGRHPYIGGLINAAYKDAVTGEWVIVLDPSLRALFAPDQFTLVGWAVRRTLDGQPLAQWLHGFYASHANPFPMRAETLLRLSGSENASPRSAQQKLRKALDAVAEASSEGFRYEIRGDLVCVERMEKKRSSKPGF